MQQGPNVTLRLLRVTTPSKMFIFTALVGLHGQNLQPRLLCSMAIHTIHFSLSMKKVNNSLYRQIAHCPVWFLQTIVNINKTEWLLNESVVHHTEVGFRNYNYLLLQHTYSLTFTHLQLQEFYFCKIQLLHLKSVVTTIVRQKVAVSML